MSALLEVKRIIEQQGEAFEEFKKANDQRIEAAEKGNTALASELDQKLARINESLAALTEKRQEKENELFDRIEELESRGSSPGRGQTTALADEYKETFLAWVRSKGESSQLKTKLDELARKATEQKDVSIGSPEGGGLAVPEVIAREIERLELLFSPVRSLVKVVRVGTSDYKELVNTRGATAGWVGETDPRTATDTSKLRERTPSHGELYAYPQVTEWSLDDIFFDVESWVSNEVSEQFAIAESLAVISGNGANKPAGMLNTAPTLAADDAASPRAGDVYQYVPSDSGGAAAVIPDELITLVYTLNSAYRSGASWTMNSNTTAAVRKLKNENGDYLWQPGLQAGQPDRLLGYPVATWEQLPDIAANAFPIAFGNFARGYLLVDRTGLRMTRDQVTNPGYVRFYIRRRVGGAVLNNNAIKWLRTVGT